MEYKPDKFEKIATRLLLAIIFAVLGAGLIVIAIVRFSNPDEELFSSSNITKGLIALLVFVLMGFAITNTNNDKDD